MKKEVKYTIDPSKHKGLVFQIARKVKNSFPSVDIYDIVQEINILIIRYSTPITEEKSVNGKKRTVCYDSSKSTESTFITNFIGTKIFQVMKYSNLINCHSENVDGKQTFKLVECKHFSSSVDSDGELALGESLQVAEGIDTSYSIDNEEISFNDIVSISENITEKERSILSMYFEESKTLEEIGIEFSLTKERIRVIKENAINKLKKNSKKIKEMV